MTHSHNNSWRPRKFRVFCSNKYFENRDEYDSVGQRQPHTFEQYVQANLKLLKQQFRQDKYSKQE